ncbi:acireductone dioxygenase [Hydra vulgaris]|uniref:Acireductone dioxygenase n=1 Tax=Hydra vulgaris TaxID=6087 RepID=T2M5T7_HYDVU|nr:1,2-dihydroxy-3-keto-5-methylthiopentene dioxygenase [Hydra vulgaris]
MVKIWLMDQSSENPYLTHKRNPNVALPVDEISKLGVFYKKMKTEDYEEGDKYLDDPELISLRNEKNYSYCDFITVSEKDLPNYEEKIKLFFQEHTHTDDEIRYIIDGSGYFDVKNQKSEWVRIFVSKGDLLSLPAGMYHRFTVDENKYIKVIRFFIGEPVWTPIYLPQSDNLPERKEYIRKYLESS